MTGDTDNLSLYKTKTGKHYESYEFCEPHLIKRQHWYKLANEVFEVVGSKMYSGYLIECVKKLK